MGYKLVSDTDYYELKLLFIQKKVPTHIHVPL